MTVLNQREGVYNACLSVMDTKSFDSALKPTTEQRAQIIAIVTEGLMTGEITMSSEAKTKYDDEKKMKGYVNGLVSNWLRKDPKLNGGEKYEIQNPGSRAGSSDPVIKELRKLVKTLTLGSPEHATVTDEITKRLAVVTAEKAKKVTIDVDQIPEALRHLIPQLAEGE